MNKNILIIALALFNFHLATAQNSFPIFYKDSITHKNNTGIGFTYDYSLYGGISYNRLLQVNNKNISLGVEVGSPILLISDRNKNISIHAGTYLLKTNFNIRSQICLNTNFYKDVISKGTYMDIQLGLHPGYYKKGYFVSAEFSYRNNIFTTFQFVEKNSGQDKRLVAYNTTGNFNFGINGGILLKKRFEVNARVYYSIARDFKNYAPYTRNIGANLGLSYWF